MSRKRVVITGMGVTSPIGNSPDEIWANAKAGVSGIDSFDENVSLPDDLNQIGGQVRNLDYGEIFGRKEVRRTDRVAHHALYAAKQAMEDARLEVTPENAYDVGVIIGTGIGGINFIYNVMYDFSQRGSRGVAPTMVPAMLSDNIPARISMEFGILGPNHCIVNACATANNCIGEAAEMIRNGRAKVAVAGASDAILIGVVMSGFHNLKTLSQWKGDPKQASRPFHAERDGFVASEGASILILEDLEHAQERGATIYAEVTGYGHTSDAFHVTAPREDGASAAQAMRLAIQDAGIDGTDLDYISAHGTATQLNDSAETVAVKKALGEHAYNVPMSSTKSMTGHMMSATGGLESILCVKAIHDNFVPPTINLDKPAEDCDLDYIPNEGREVEVKHTLNNAFGFGGHNAVLVISEFEE